MPTPATGGLTALLWLVHAAQIVWPAVAAPAPATTSAKRQPAPGHNDLRLEY
jgi:hypothetical protein